jgi:hypothetical protein
MARRIRSADLETRTARLKLDVRKKPYTARIAPGIRLAYRRNQVCGVWSVLKADGAGGAWLQRFALADDHEESNGFRGPDVLGSGRDRSKARARR